jgi:hypothetical protein
MNTQNRGPEEIAALEARRIPVVLPAVAPVGFAPTCWTKYFRIRTVNGLGCRQMVTSGLLWGKGFRPASTVRFLSFPLCKPDASIRRSDHSGMPTFTRLHVYSSTRGPLPKRKPGKRIPGVATR